MKPSYLFILFLFVCVQTSAQKTISATYLGGHGCIETELKLYTDSSFTYVETSAMIFLTKSKRKGIYSIQGDQIVMFTRKKLAFLYFRASHKYTGNSYRIRDNHILMYSEEDEHGADANMIRDYNTLWKSKG